MQSSQMQRIRGTDSLTRRVSMKNKIIIIENNFCKFFATKLMIETQLKLQASIYELSDLTEALNLAKKFSAHSIVYCPNGSVADLLYRMKKKGLNRRNTEITLVLAEEGEGFVSPQLKKSLLSTLVSQAA